MSFKEKLVILYNNGISASSTLEKENNEKDLLWLRENMLNELIQKTEKFKPFLTDEMLQADKKYIEILEEQVATLKFKYGSIADNSYNQDGRYSYSIEKLVSPYIDLMDKNKDNGIYDVFTEFRPSYDGSNKSFQKVLSNLKEQGVDIKVLYKKDIEQKADEERYKAVYYVAFKSCDYGKFIKEFNKISDAGQVLSPSEELIGKREMYFVPPMINKTFTLNELKEKIKEKEEKYGDYVRFNQFGLGYTEINGNRRDVSAIEPCIRECFKSMFKKSAYDTHGTFMRCPYTYTIEEFKDNPVTVQHEMAIYKKGITIKNSQDQNIDDSEELKNEKNKPKAKKAKIGR